MTIKEKIRLLKGRTIVDVHLRCFRTGRSGRQTWATDPEFVLDDGTTVTFSVQETEVGEYGISVNPYPKP